MSRRIERKLDAWLLWTAVAFALAWGTYRIGLAFVESQIDQRFPPPAEQVGRK